MNSQRRSGRSQRGDGRRDSGNLSDAFWAHYAHSAAARPPQELENALQDILETAQAAWPDVQVPAEAFCRHLAERLPNGTAPLAALGEVRGQELYLACGCALGLPQALAAFDRDWMPQVLRALARIDSNPAAVEEIQQQLRQKLFVSHQGKRAKIADYTGRGSLAAWLRAAAIRTALNQKAQRKPEIPIDDAGSDELPMTGDPELDFLRRRYQNDFKEAFHGALDSLSDRQINVLRLSVVDGLNIDKIGELFKTHRSTVARWLVQTRKQLLDETRNRLAVKLRLRPSEIESFMRLIRSEMNASISRYLRVRKPR